MTTYIVLILLASVNIFLIAISKKVSKMVAILGWVVVITSSLTCMNLKYELNRHPKHIKVSVETAVDTNGKVQTRWEDK